jgi:hypothetical protein
MFQDVSVWQVTRKTCSLSKGDETKDLKSVGESQPPLQCRQNLEKCQGLLIGGGRHYQSVRGSSLGDPSGETHAFDASRLMAAVQTGIVCRRKGDSQGQRTLGEGGDAVVVLVGSGACTESVASPAQDGFTSYLVLAPLGSSTSTQVPHSTLPSQTQRATKCTVPTISTGIARPKHGFLCLDGCQHLSQKRLGHFASPGPGHVLGTRKPNTLILEN